MKLTHERKVELNTPGSLPLLYSIITENGIEISTQAFMNTLRSYVEKLPTPNQKLVFTAFYMKQRTPSEIRNENGFSRWSDVERPLASATKNYISMLNADKDKFIK